MRFAIGTIALTIAVLLNSFELGSQSGPPPDSSEEEEEIREISPPPSRIRRDHINDPEWDADPARRRTAFQNDFIQYMAGQKRNAEKAAAAKQTTTQRKRAPQQAAESHQQQHQATSSQQRPVHASSSTQLDSLGHRLPNYTPIMLSRSEGPTRQSESSSYRPSRSSFQYASELDSLDHRLPNYAPISLSRSGGSTRPSESSSSRPSRSSFQYESDVEPPPGFPPRRRGPVRQTEYEAIREVELNFQRKPVRGSNYFTEAENGELRQEPLPHNAIETSINQNPAAAEAQAKREAAFQLGSKKYAAVGRVSQQKTADFFKRRREQHEANKSLD